jgi:RHS repeat-associated protein
LGFAWDDAGRLSSLTDIHGIATTYGYDAANRLTTVTRAGKTTTYQYDKAGRLASLTYPNGVSCDFTYDHDSRLTRMLWEKDATLLYHLEYRYDRAGNRTRRMVTKSPEAALIEDFNYDVLSRLVRVDENGSLRAHYKYDPAGNRLLKKRPPTLSSPSDVVVVDNDELYEYDASDELVAMNSTRFRWDRVGQLVEKDDPAQANPTLYEWNAAHRLAKVTLPDLTSAEYRYNSDELRIWRREPLGAETNYYWVPSGILGLSQVLNETDGNGARKADYVLGPNGLIALIDGSGHERYYVFDALGSVLALTDETGAVTDTYAYDEYGLETSATGTSYNPMRYTGQQWDADEEIVYLRNRSCAPAQGRFLRRDPLGMDSYRYAFGNPQTYTDPEGLLAAVDDLTLIFLAFSTITMLVANIVNSEEFQKAVRSGARAAQDWMRKNFGGIGRHMCVVKCPVIQIDTGSCCPPFTYGIGFGPTEGIAQAEAEFFGRQSTPRGCRTRHCHKLACIKK